MDFGVEKLLEYDIKSFDYKQFDRFYYMKIKSKRHLEMKTLISFAATFRIHKINTKFFSGYRVILFLFRTANRNHSSLKIQILKIYILKVHMCMFICVPACVCLFIGLEALGREQGYEELWG